MLEVHSTYINGLAVHSRLSTRTVSGFLYMSAVQSHHGSEGKECTGWSAAGNFRRCCREYLPLEKEKGCAENVSVLA